MAAVQDPPLSILVLSGSSRADSLNTRLARLVQRTVESNGVRAELATMAEFDGPSYDQDLQDATGVPPGPARLRERLEATDGFVIVSPEYNASVPGGLKNAIDWVSRIRPQPFQGRHALLMSASPSLVGGNRGLWSLRIPLEHLGTGVYPAMFSLARADRAFTSDGELVEPGLAEHMRTAVAGFLALVEASERYPSMKTAWVEHLGEVVQPGPLVDAPA